MSRLLLLVLLTIISSFISIPFSVASDEFTGVKRKNIYFEGTEVQGIDIHFHAADDWDQLGSVAQRFIQSKLPGFIPDFLKNFSLKALTGFIYNPYGMFGILRECNNSGFSYCGLFATYAPNSWGIISNEYVLGKLDSPKNIAKKTGKQMFFGLASIDVLDWVKNEKINLAKLDRSLKKDGFKGIKLAFIHNEVPLDERSYDSIYAMAVLHDVPVYHHVGSSPLRTLDDFETEEEKKNYLKSYDPTLLNVAVKKFPKAKFILGHMGFDFNAEGYDFSDEVFDLAKNNENVYLEISAFGRKLFDPEGKFMDHVMCRLKNDGLLNRTVFGSDGPLYPGATKDYLIATLKSMERCGYTAEQAETVLYHTAKSIFKL
jgi:uncharacterized protein